VRPTAFSQLRDRLLSTTDVTADASNVLDDARHHGRGWLRVVWPGDRSLA